MRVLVADNHEDGMYKCRGELLEALAKTAEVYISVPEGKYTKAMVQMGCHFEKLSIDRRGMNPLMELSLIFEYRRLINRIKPDVVLTYSIKPNVYLGWICSLKKIPYIANVTGLGSSIQGGGLTKKLTLLLYKMGLRKANMVFCQNKANMELLQKQHIIKGACILLPGSGVNLSAHPFEQYPPDTFKLRFLTIGRIMKDKGTSELIEAAKIVKERYPDVSFSMIGFYDGDYEQIITEAEKKGLIHFYGHQDDVHSFIKESHAIVHPSYHEGMANALLESAAAGRPVIATDVPGCIETYEPDVTGISCHPRDSASLADAIIRFIELPYQEKVQMGLRARKKMEDEFDRAIVLNRYKEEINQIRRSKNVAL